MLGMANIRRSGNREVEPFEVSAYELGRQLAFLPKRTKRQTVIRREVRLDEYGHPLALIEESSITEETEF